MKYEFSRPEDLADIKKLLSSAALPSQDVNRYPDGFIIARMGGRIVGVIGMELHGKASLLRSLAVHPDHRGKGVAKELFRRIVINAKRSGVKELYLLTMTIEALCKKWGFKKIARNKVPRGIFTSKEFHGLCPESAVCMHQAIAEIDYE
jgi:amino-acid N-acetyltransferase